MSWIRGGSTTWYKLSDIFNRDHLVVPSLKLGALYRFEGVSVVKLEEDWYSGVVTVYQTNGAKKELKISQDKWKIIEPFLTMIPEEEALALLL